MPQVEQRRRRAQASQWHLRYHKQIQAIQAKHALRIRSLSNKAKVNPATARRLIDQNTKHFRDRNCWNLFQEWIKWNRRGGDEPSAAAIEDEQRDLEPQEEAEPALSDDGIDAGAGDPAAANGPGTLAADGIEPAVPRTTRMADIHSAYLDLTMANKKYIKAWATKRIGKKTALDSQKEMNLACRDLVARITNLQLRFGISAVAILAHPGEGIRPQIALTDQTDIAIGSALNRISKGTTADNLAVMFDRAVKLAVWERPENEKGMDTPVCTLPRKQRLANDLIKRLHLVVGPALAADEGALSNWSKPTRKGTRLRYKGLFSMVAAARCMVQGWPTAADDLLGNDAMKDHDADGTTMTIWSGSLKNTADWKEEPVRALRAALRDETLRAACIVSTAPAAGATPGSGDEFRDGGDDF